MRLPLKAIAAIAAKSRALRGVGRIGVGAARMSAGGLRKIGRGYLKAEHKFKPFVQSPDRLGKFAFRTDVAGSVVGTGLTIYGAHLVNKDRKDAKKAQRQRDQALNKFKMSLQQPSRRVRRLKEMT